MLENVLMLADLRENAVWWRGDGQQLRGILQDLNQMKEEVGIRGLGTT